MPRRKPQPKKTTSERGYGYEHQKMRAFFKPRVDAGLERCRRCGHPIPPGGEGPCPAIRNMRRCGANHHGWDLGHTWGQQGWSGPEHQCCNRGAKKCRQRRVTNKVRQVLRQTREW